jgi:type I site-specific restriction-modification system R (restriction) subunit
MLIAEQKRKENIAEYLIYMYQVEDLIRANQLDLERVEQTLISQFEVDYAVKREMREWYKALIHMMREEQKERKGHLLILNNIVEQMEEMHREILKQGYDSTYKNLYERARGHIEALRMRSGHSHESDIQVALNGLYGLLILKLKKTPITSETAQAFEAITELVAELNLRYMEGKS